MNKTVTINLAGLLFHIDEDAFKKLKDYLNVLKNAYANEQGSEEIISDIEARIAELFNDAKLHELQVIDIKNVDAAIEIMGQPEDLFEGEENAFENETQKQEDNSEANSQKKQLFRDTSDAYISGVSSGLGHYFEVSVIWIRLAWLCLVFFSGGGFILLYVSLWFFVPEAKTTAEKLAMKGKSVNVNTIEEKIKEGFNSVADTMKNAYHKTNGKEIKNKSAVVVSKLERFIGQFFKIAGRLLGICLMIFSGIGIISLFATFLGFNIINISDSYWFDYSEFAHFGSPLWLTSIIIFLTAAIPLFFIFILGLKISFPNAKKIGRTLILSLVGLWLLTIIAFIISQIRSEKLNMASASNSSEETLNITSNDTLKIFMKKQERYTDKFKSTSDFLIRETMDGQKILVFQDLKIYVQTSKNETPYIKIKKQAKGATYNEALELAKKINFDYTIENNNLFIDGYALGNYGDKYRGQKVKVFLMLPENSTLLADTSTRNYNNSRKPTEFAVIKNKESHYLKLKNGKAICADCIENEQDKNDINIDLDLNFDDENFEEELEEKIERLIENNMDDDNHDLDINGKNFSIKINEHGIQINSEKKQ